MRFSSHLIGIGLLSLWTLLGTGCKDNPSHGTPPPKGTPPPAESAPKAGACDQGGGKISDTISAGFFPTKAGDYCVSPASETKTFGDKAKKPMDGICTLFDGGCKEYQNHNVKRTVVVDYVDGKGSPGTVTVILSQFENANYAFTMFARRVTSNEDPVRDDMPKPLEIGGLAALGTGKLYAWKGPYLIELDYVNTDESGDAKKLRASGEKILPALAKSMVAKLPGSANPPENLSVLPKDSQIPLGFGFWLKDSLNVKGTGDAALAYYKKGDKRYRMLAMVRKDNDQAKDILKTFGDVKGAKKLKNIADGAVRLMLLEEKDNKDGPKAEWVLARQGRHIIGVGDDVFAFKEGSSVSEQEKVSLSKDDKIKLVQETLKSLK
jgi:hypothetical protein